MHLKHRSGQREEFQTILSDPHEFRKPLIRVFRLKGLIWNLLRVEEGGRLTRLPKLMQILEEQMDFVIKIEARKKQKRPDAPSSSTGRHFERDSQKIRRVNLYGNHRKWKLGRSHTLNLLDHPVGNH
jgi:hypothetical protein